MSQWGNGQTQKLILQTNEQLSASLEHENKTLFILDQLELVRLLACIACLK